MQNKTKNFFRVSAEDFKKIPGSPIAYWVSNAELNTYSFPLIEKVAKPCKGIDTGNNDLFLRFWHEVPINKFSHPQPTAMSAEYISNFDWFALLP